MIHEKLVKGSQLKERLTTDHLRNFKEVVIIPLKRGKKRKEKKRNNNAPGPW